MDWGPPGSSVHRISLGKNTGVGYHFLLQGVFPTQGSNTWALHCRWILYHLSHQGSLWTLEWVAYPFSRGSSQPRNWTRVSCIAGGFFTSWATREAQSSHKYTCTLPLETSFHPAPRPAPLGCSRAPGWASCVIKQFPTSYLFDTNVIFNLFSLMVTCFSAMFRGAHSV